MEEEKLDEILKGQDEAPVVEEKLRTPMTILFSDIKGSTAYFERYGDVEGLAMVQRHNDLLFPCVENNHGRIIKTIGDAIMALFNNPVDAMKAAAAMQRSLFDDRSNRSESQRVHIRIGLHTGLGLMQDNDVFGDVVNASARVQSQSEPDQILITDSLLHAAETAGMQVGKLGRARMKGKDEPIDIYAVAWSGWATQQLIDDLQTKFDGGLRGAKERHKALEEEFDAARDGWREERRRLNAEVERLEEGALDAMETARNQVSEEFQKQHQFKQEATDKARGQAEEDLKGTQERFEAERVSLKAQIANLEGRLVEAMERSNNPARAATQIREQVQTRLDQAKKEWQAQWEVERKRLEAEIENAKTAGQPKDPMAEARRLMMEKIKAKQEGREPGTPGAELAAAKEKAEKERDELQARVAGLEKEVQNAEEIIRQEVYNDLRHKYDQKLEAADRIKKQLQHEVQSLSEQLQGERESLSARINQLEADVSEAENAARVQASAEVRSDYESKLDDAERARSRLERRHQEAVEEMELERSRLEKQVKTLEAGVQEAREMAFKRSSDPTIEELNRLRHHLEEEFREKTAAWEDEKRHLLEKIARLENPEDG